MIRLATVLIPVILIGVTICDTQAHSAKEIEHFLQREFDGFIGCVRIGKGAPDDSNVALILPNNGINYNYWFDERFSIEMYNRFVALSYVVNTDSHRDLDRWHSISSTTVGVFQTWKNLSFFIGPGKEFGNHQSLSVLSFDIDDKFSLSNDRHLSPRFTFDNLGGDIQALTLGVSVSRKF